MAVHEIGLVFAMYPKVFRTTRTNYWGAETPLVSTIIVFPFRKVINWPFPIIDRTHGLRISIFGSERMDLFYSVFLNYLTYDW